MPTALLATPGRKSPIAFESLAVAKPELQAMVNNLRNSKFALGSMSFADRLFGASATASRRHSTSNISITDWLDQPRVSKEYKTSLHVDPAQELPDTTKQDDYIREVASKLGIIQMKDYAVQDTTKDRFSYELTSDEYNMDRNALNSYSDPANRPASQSDLQESNTSETITWTKSAAAIPTTPSPTNSKPRCSACISLTMLPTIQFFDSSFGAIDIS